MYIYIYIYILYIENIYIYIYIYNSADLKGPLRLLGSALTVL